MTGLSGAGKTTLCRALHAELGRRNQHVVLLDGDDVRAAFGDDLGHSEPDRIIQVTRLRAIAALLARQGFGVIVSVLYTNPDLLAWNRKFLPGYLEVYLRASISFLSARDDKRLYARAAAGEVHDVVGIDIPYQEPRAPDLLLDAEASHAPEALVQMVLDHMAVPPLKQ